MPERASTAVPRTLVVALAAATFAHGASAAAAGDLPAAAVAYVVVGDAIPRPLTGTPGDASRGRAIVVDRRVGMCLLCHRGPFPEEPMQGTIGTALAGVGARLDESRLRLRVVDSQRLHPDSVMPPYHRVDGLTRVGTAWASRPILSAQQVEDVVAFLRTLRD